MFTELSCLHQSKYAGVVLAGVLGKVMEVVKGGPQKMQQMAMEQMMKQMMKQMGAPPGGCCWFDRCFGER